MRSAEFSHGKGFGDDGGFKDVLAMGAGAAPIISREAVLEEAKRRGILGATYDPEADLERLERPVDDGVPEDEPEDVPVAA